ncbi:MAG: multi-sensor signal transduction histidine kinase [Myxococcales bacterium]|nr:multi-sensor signal transduction histidine kinase [Myxococcales bacterium]
MAGLAQRASGWVRGRVRSILEWPCRDELARLRLQGRRFSDLLDAVEDAVLLNDSSGRLSFANRAAAALLRDLTGREPETMVGKQPAELGLPAELARFIVTELERVDATQAAITHEVVVPQSGGGGRWYEQKISPVFTDGRLSAYVMIGRDIDARKRAQRRLELLSKVSLLVGNLELDELLPAIAKLSIPELADWSAVDVRGDEKTVRRLYVAQRDPGKAELAAKLQRVHPWTTRAGWRELVAGRSLFIPEVTDEVLRANAEDSEHLALLRQLGLRSAIAVPLRVRDATVAVMTFATTGESATRFGRDDLALAEELARRAAIIIDRARLHAELKANEARFRVALAASRTAVFEQDRELRYRWHYNAAVDRDTIGKTHADLFPNDEAALLTAIKRRVLDTGERVHDEIQLTAGGEPRVWAIAVDPLRDERGAIVGIIGAANDVTDAKRVQAELAQAVTFREQLMSILGHDLRNPLGAILAATGLLRRRQDLASPTRDHVDRIDRAAWRMAEMIRTLLDVAQVRFHGSLPVSPAPTDLAEVARAIVDELRAAEPDRAIELDVRGDANGQWDRARLGEVLSNLVGNALVHGTAGEPVRVAIDVSGDDVRLRVHNGGEPITPEMRAALFEPFRRGAQETGTFRGLGLGLYIVRQIVLAHGGAITVDSTPTDGTTFTVRLPRAPRPSVSLSAAP